MGVEDFGGYLTNPDREMNKVIAVVDAAIANGIYAIIDWHLHHAEDNTQSAVQFFSEMSALYGNNDHVIYEVYNESIQSSWSGTIKPYTEQVIQAIRANDLDNLIDETFGVYPNPSIGIINISGIKNGDQIIIFDLSGKQVYREIANENTMCLNITTLDVGIYLLKVNGNNSQRIIKN